MWPSEDATTNIRHGLFGGRDALRKGCLFPQRENTKARVSSSLHAVLTARSVPFELPPTHQSVLQSARSHAFPSDTFWMASVSQGEALEG